MKLPNFLDFEPLNSLKQRMGIPRTTLGSLVVDVSVGRLSESELEKLTSIYGLDVKLDELTILPDGTLALKNSRVLLYIRDIADYGRGEIEPRYHVANCSTLVQMRRNQRFDRYAVAATVDGRFKINVISGASSREVTLQLRVCQNCLDCLSFDGFKMQMIRTKRLSIVQSFSLDRFFNLYPRSLHNQLPQYTSLTAPLNQYTADSKEVFQQLKEKVGWRCEECGLSLSDPKFRQWLHAHHLNGQKWDNRPGNLRVLCLGCHANQPSHAHMKSTTDYREFESFRSQIMKQR